MVAASGADAWPRGGRHPWCARAYDRPHARTYRTAALMSRDDAPCLRAVGSGLPRTRFLSDRAKEPCVRSERVSMPICEHGVDARSGRYEPRSTRVNATIRCGVRSLHSPPAQSWPCLAADRLGWGRAPIAPADRRVRALCAPRHPHQPAHQPSHTRDGGGSAPRVHPRDARRVILLGDDGNDGRRHCCRLGRRQGLLSRIPKDRIMPVIASLLAAVAVLLVVETVSPDRQHSLCHRIETCPCG